MSVRRRIRVVVCRAAVDDGRQVLRELPRLVWVRSMRDVQVEHSGATGSVGAEVETLPVPRDRRVPAVEAGSIELGPELLRQRPARELSGRFIEPRTLSSGPVGRGRLVARGERAGCKGENNLAGERTRTAGCWQHGALGWSVDATGHGGQFGGKSASMRVGPPAGTKKTVSYSTATAPSFLTLCGVVPSKNAVPAVWTVGRQSGS